MARVIHNSKVLIQNVQLRMKKNRLNQQQGLLEVNCFIRIQLTGKKMNRMHWFVQKVGEVRV